MKLIYTTSSPFARLVRLYAAELDLADQLELVRSHPFDDEPTLLDANPLGRVPALVRDDGQPLVDSLLICIYLHQRVHHEMPNLEVLHRTMLANGLAETAVSLRMEQTRHKGERSPHWMSRWTERAHRMTTSLATAISRQDPGDGAAALDQCALASSLAYVDFRHPDLDWRANSSGLAEWFSTFSERPSMKTTALVG